MASILSQGTTIGMGTVAGTYTTIANITGFSGPSTTRTVIDTTTLASTDKEFTLGLRDNGELSLDINYDTDAHDALDDALEAGTVRYFEIEYSNGDSRTFAGYVMSLVPEGSLDSLLTAKVSIKISGAVLRVQGS